MKKITSEQLDAELSDDYKAWSNDPTDCDFIEPVEEVGRLCEVIVKLRRKLAAKERAPC
jgi:hypothetical protein